MEMTQLASKLFVEAQIAEKDLAEIAGEGFMDVAWNCLDAEHPRCAASSKMTEAARGLGVAFHDRPITPGEPLAEDAEELAGGVAQPAAKVFADCRTEMGAIDAWSLNQANRVGGGP